MSNLKNYLKGYLEYQKIIIGSIIGSWITIGETSIDEIINTIAEIKESKNEIKENLEGNVKSQQRLAVTTNVKLI